MNLKRETGYTGIDIAISVVVLFIFVSLISFLFYGFNSSTKEMQLKSEATAMAVEEIEILKNSLTFDQIASIGKDNENSQGYGITKETEKDGFYKTISIEDYADIYENKVYGLVKKVTVKIEYNFKGNTQTVQLSTIFSKES